MEEPSGGVDPALSTELTMDFAALLLVATLFGGMMLYSFGFAPLVFKTLDAATAGHMLRTAFPWYYLFVIVAAGLAGITLLSSASRMGLGQLMLVIAAAAVYARQVLMPQINAARDASPGTSTAARGRFARLHGLSVLINFLQLIGAGYVLYRFSPG
jgi:hypothetical protein